MRHLWLIGAGLNGFSGLAAGAFAAHADSTRLSTEFSTQALAWLKTGGFHQLVHGAALLGLASLSVHRPGRLLDLAGLCFFLGPLLFAFSLYALAFGRGFLPGFVTPMGGGLMLLGWLLLIPAGLGRRMDRP